MSKSQVTSSTVEVSVDLALAGHRQVEVDDVPGLDDDDGLAAVVPVVVDLRRIDAVLLAHRPPPVVRFPVWIATITARGPPRRRWKLAHCSVRLVASHVHMLARVRRIPSESLLLGTVLLWSFNFTAVRYGVTHGFEPLVYVALRWSIAGVALTAIVLLRGQSLRLRRRELRPRWPGVRRRRLRQPDRVQLRDRSGDRLHRRARVRNPSDPRVAALATRRLRAPPAATLAGDRCLVRRRGARRGRGRRWVGHERRGASCSPSRPRSASRSTRWRSCP